MDLVLTLDYELFGNGSGNVFTDMIEPTNVLLELCEKYNAKMTIFFEVVEYLKLKAEWEKGNKMGYCENPALAMEEQMKKALSLGHDIQLHIHPQWLNAKYIDGEWQVDNHWCMKDIPLEKTSGMETDLKTILKTGKDTLEEILKPINPEYKCHIFRAGGFNILPSERIIPVLKELGFVADSSVYAGGYEINELAHIDFRTLKNTIPYWCVNDDNVLNQHQDKKDEIFVELPIFATSVMRLLKYDITRMKIILKNKKSSLQTIQNRTADKSLREKIKFFFEKEYLTWDYCLFGRKKINLFLKKAKEIQRKTTYKYHPFVLIGHSKGFHFAENFEYLLKKQDLNFITLTEMYEKIMA